MLHGYKKRIFPIMLSLALILNLIMIPGIHSQAASYSAETSFTYNYGGYNYQFYYSGSTDVPYNYRFDSSALDYLLQKSAEGINISISSGIGAKISGILSSGLSSIFNLYRNFVIATDKLVADWIVWDDIYGFEFQFTGVDSSYPGHETYGDAYGWSFIGWLGEKIDLVLDSQGMLYGSNPIGNYTFSDDQRDFGTWSIHQHDGDDFWMPSVNLGSFNNFDLPYIEGKSLYWKMYYVNGTSSWFRVDNFVDTYISVNYNSNTNCPVLWFYSPSAVNNTYSDITNIEGGYFREKGHIGNGGKSNVLYISFYTDTPWSNAISGFNLPNNYRDANGSTWNLSSTVNCKGFYNNTYLTGSFPYIYLAKLTTTPLPDPIVLPVDDPIPVSDIQPDPIDFTPDPDDDPDPVPGVDYPGNDPQPVPVPPLPPLVSGNDDLWPDMNGVFEVESEIDGFLGGLSNFEFTPLRTLVEGFSSSLIWVSTIMMALYNGSDFSILFVVLSIFFIAAALLGIYKWWTH